MTHPIAERLRALQAEYDSGHMMLADLDARRTSLSNTHPVHGPRAEPD
jgi:hypothetical protein